MIWTLFALLSLVILGGFISYYGDLQGRRWGKKRVSWFGMRPKHTAILITSLTGAFISLLSILTLLLISPVMRDVILRGEKAIREKKQISEKYSEDMGRSKYQMTLVNDALVNTKQELTKAQQDRVRTLAQLEAARKQLKPMLEAVAQLEHKQKNLMASLSKTKAENEHFSNSNYDLAKQNLGMSRENIRLEQTNKSLLTTNVDLTAQNEDLQQKRNTLTKSNEALTRTNEALERVTNAQLEANKDQLRTSAEQLRVQSEELGAKRRELALVTAQLEKARQDLNYAADELEGTRRYFTLTYDQVRRGRISVRAGGELARAVIDAHMSANVVRTQLVKLLDEASKKAQALGAAKGQNGRAVLIVTQRVATQASEFTFGEEERLSGFTQLLAGTDKPTVVIVSAFTNAVEGEQVIVNLQPDVAAPMFAAGKQIAACRLNANLPDDQIKEAIAQFLQTNVRNALLKAGAVSQVDPVTGISELGQLDPIELGLVTLRARQMHGDLILRAVAKADITSADPLDRNHLRLEVVRASGNSKDS